ncbi:MAG TPA: MFS transporter [Candidatus Binatia bacterium]|nr:MFS transporter [Candidatus Binatia bacterium]
MNFSPLTLYVLAAIFQTAGSSGAAMLAPFFMKAHGYSVAAAGVPLVANGVGRVCSDVMSGIMATYFSPGSLLFAAMIIGIATSIVGYAFMDAMPVFLTAWIIFGLTEAMFALSLRKIGFDQSPPDRQGRVQGQMASALGIGFTLGPLFGGFVGKWLGPDGLFFLYAAPQLIGMVIVFLAGAHRYRQKTQTTRPNLWREGRQLLGKIPFLASCLAICQSFLFLIGVTRVAFPFLAVNLRGISLETVGMIVSISRLTDTFGRYVGGRLCDRIRPASVILLGVALGVPMLLLQVLGSGWVTLMIPLAIMTMGFGFTNVGATTFALQSADRGAKELALGISRASTSFGQAIGPLVCGALIEQMGYEGGFQTMAFISAVVLIVTWIGLKK